MINNKHLKKIYQILDKLDQRTKNLEKKVDKLEKNKLAKLIKPSPSQKTFTLPELIKKGKSFKNGQQKVAVIVGYHEKIRKKLVSKKDIKKSWINAKFEGKFNYNFISRAISDGLIRPRDSETFDLTRSGELFFDSFINPSY